MRAGAISCCLSSPVTGRSHPEFQPVSDPAAAHSVCVVSSTNGPLYEIVVDLCNSRHGEHIICLWMDGELKHKSEFVQRHERHPSLPMGGRWITATRLENKGFVFPGVKEEVIAGDAPPKPGLIVVQVALKASREYQTPWYIPLDKRLEPQAGGPLLATFVFTYMPAAQLVMPGVLEESEWKRALALSDYLPNRTMIYSSNTQ